jgi:hypothetical protein
VGRGRDRDVHDDEQPDPEQLPQTVEVDALPDPWTAEVSAETSPTGGVSASVKATAPQVS